MKHLKKRKYPGQLNISGFPEPLLIELDKYAALQRRSRSAQTVLLLQEILALKKAAAGGFRVH